MFSDKSSHILLLLVCLSAYNILLPTSVKGLKNIFASDLVLNGFKILLLTVEKSLFVEKFIDPGKFLFVENFLVYGKSPGIRKKIFAVNFLFCGKFP